MPRNDDQETGCLREKQVRELVPVAHSTLWEWVEQGIFPKPVKLSARVTVWRRSEVQAWIETKFQGAS